MNQQFNTSATVAIAKSVAASNRLAQVRKESDNRAVDKGVRLALK